MADDNTGVVQVLKHATGLEITLSSSALLNGVPGRMCKVIR
ncbi:MAG: hypothetical protein O7D33_09475 [Chloroflexi bacterium]|nr:hypothetical protein [Chloroflexota bacterium]